MGITIRPATQDDLAILWDFLAIAAYEADVAAAKAVPFVAMHLDGWQRSEDFGFIAERDAEAIGAAWARQFSPDEQPAFHIDGRTPEVTIGVSEAARGQGIGARLLRALLAEAAQRGVGLCLNVRHDNPARRLYERLGFRLVPRSRRTQPGRRHVIRHDMGGTAITWTSAPCAGRPRTHITYLVLYYQL